MTPLTPLHVASHHTLHFVDVVLKAMFPAVRTDLIKQQKLVIIKYIFSSGYFHFPVFPLVYEIR